MGDDSITGPRLRSQAASTLRDRPTLAVGGETRERVRREHAWGLRGRARLRLLGIGEGEASYERNGFTALDEHAREHLELVGRWFVRGYRAALAEPHLDLLALTLDQAPADFRGFAYEGAGTALTMLDVLMPTRRRLRAFLRGPGFAYGWILPIGYGWARMQLRLLPRHPPPVFDALQGSAVHDGAGFYVGFGKPWYAFEQRRVPGGLSRQAARVFDQGLGRSLWFVRGADVERISAVLQSFGAERQANLWSGVASAATYAGGVGEDVLIALRDAAGEHLLEVGVGAAVATKARLLGGNPTLNTESACRILCGVSTVEAARCADGALEGLKLERSQSPYEAWRTRIGELLQARG